MVKEKKVDKKKKEKKIAKNKYPFGEKPKVFLIFLILFSLLPFTSAITYWQQRVLSLTDNNTVLDRIAITFPVNDGTTQSLTRDYFESYVQYDIYIDAWNLANPNYYIDWCNVAIDLFEHNANETSYIFNTTYFNGSGNIYGAKYFIQLRKGDIGGSSITCHFGNSTNRILDIPINQQMTFPSYECEGCQHYDWLLQQRKVSRAITLGDYYNDTFDFIKKIIYFNYEIIIMLFWVLMIALLVGCVMLIFVGGYWVVTFLSKLVKK
jgi:hypothetical protein